MNIPTDPPEPRATLHGVFLEVLDTGVLLIGEAGVGKSELALELIARGHRLIADDAPEFACVGPQALTGQCPSLLRDFLEVRGLGILNIRAMFGAQAVRDGCRMLDLVVALRRLSRSELAAIDRLAGTLASRTVLGVCVPEITLPVAPGRNLAVLVETAVRARLLRLRGYDPVDDLIARQTRALALAVPGRG